MEGSQDLTTGKIFGKLLKLTVPIIATSFVQVAYNLTDQMWLGTYSRDAVAAVGLAGFWLWFSIIVVQFNKVGVQVGVANSFGAKNRRRCNRYIKHGIVSTLFLVLIYGILSFIFADQLIGFFSVDSANGQVTSWGVDYYRIVILSYPAMGFSLLFAGVYAGLGNSKTPFYISVAGLLVNMTFDPLLINGWLGFPELGVKGAAISTFAGQTVVVLLYLYFNKKLKYPIYFKDLFKRLDWSIFRKIIVVGGPISVNMGFLCVVAMWLMRFTSRFGENGVAVQSIGAQIESISWMTALGFSMALSTFVGQNYGAKNIERIKRGYLITHAVSFVFGLFVTVFMVSFGKEIFSIFLPDSPAGQELGRLYLVILGSTQVFMSAEIVTRGAFQGIGQTFYSSVFSSAMLLARIPLSLFLINHFAMHEEGIWYSMAATTIIKGVVLSIAFWFVIKRKSLMDNL
ncbi:MAG: MATE family efflux transporter [Lentisphaeria bacterium]|nr:MATE family efflux transporter [Lentisphaeria bacterium]